MHKVLHVEQDVELGLVTLLAFERDLVVSGKALFVVDETLLLDPDLQELALFGVEGCHLLMDDLGISQIARLEGLAGLFFDVGSLGFLGSRGEVQLEGGVL